MPRRIFDLNFPLDLERTLAPLRRGRLDPTCRLAGDEFHYATRLQSGDVSLRLCRQGDSILAEAWGEGSDEALASAWGLVGGHDSPESFDPTDSYMRGLRDRFPGVLMTRAVGVVEKLIPTILEQKVTGKEARKSYLQLVDEYGEPAPGPLELKLSPRPEILAGLSYWELHRFGIERRRAATLIRSCSMAPTLERLSRLTSSNAFEKMISVPGIGRWTAAEVIRLTHGDPDMVSLGDFHLPNLVSFALAGEARGDDSRMLELLEPYKGHRARAVRLIELSGTSPPRFGPRRPLRRIASI